MFEKDPIWFSQVLMTYQDKMYDTEAYLRISLSTNTQDFQYFNPVNLAISISTPTRTKVCSLNIQNSLDLYNSLAMIIKNQDSVFKVEGEPSQIIKKYGKDYDLILEFVIEPNNRKKVVRMIIRSNETDTVKIVIPFDPVFTTLAFRVKYFQEHYETISSTLVNTFLLKEVLIGVRQIPNLIKGIPASITNISSGVPFKMSEEALKEPPISEEKKQHLEESYQSLDNFLGGDNLENIKIPDVDPEPIKEEVFGMESKTESKIEASKNTGSLFIDKYLNKDIQKIIDFLNVSEMNKAPFLLIRNELTKNLGFEVTPGISLEDEKSVLYLSKYLASSILKRNTENGTSIPMNLPILQYKAENFDSKNFDLAIDLLVINAVLRDYRKRMETKISADSFANGSISYALFRCYLDILTFSFIKEKDCKSLANIVTSRFNTFDFLNIFKKLNNELDAYNLSKIESKSISSYIEEMIQKNIFEKNYLKDTHTKLFEANFCKLPYNNNLSLEQIINELIPAEVMTKVGRKIPKDFPMTDPVREFFEKPKGIPGRKPSSEKPQKASEPKEEKVIENNLQRFVRNFRDQIPDKFRDDVMSIIGSGIERVFEKLAEKVSLEEFGDDIVKGFYLWDPEKDSQQQKNYKYFYELYENELMTKELILAKMKKPEEKSEKTLFEEIKFDI